MDGSVVVIGGGIVGTAIAHELQSKGVETVLIDRDLTPQGTSAFSFASISAFDELQRDVYLLKTHGMIEWRRWATTFGDELGVRFSGELRWAESEEAASYLATTIERATSRGYPVSRIPGEAIAKHEPSASPGDVAVASFAARDGQADPVKAIHVLRRAFSDAGGTILVGRADVRVEGEGLSVRVGEERLSASTVVVAAGAETAALLDRLGWEIPMDPSPGLLAITEPIAPTILGTVYIYPERGRAIHLRQLADGRVLVGERAQDEVTKDPTLAHARLLIREAKRSFPALAAVEVQDFSVEWRPMPRDGMPIVGPLPGLHSLYVAVAHGGVTMAPGLARFVAEEIVDGEPVDRLAPFRPDRFATHDADAYRSVEDVFSGASEMFIG